MRSARFGIICLLAAASLFPSRAHADSADPSLQGLWFGKELNRKPVNGVLYTVFLVQQEKLFVISGQGVFASALRCATNTQLPELDLDRYDGRKQHGVYRVIDAELHMTLADPGKERPFGDSVEKAGGVPHSHYVFQRMPTKEGLELLQRHVRSGELLTQVSEQNDTPELPTGRKLKSTSSATPGDRAIR